MPLCGWPASQATSACTGYDGDTGTVIYAGGGSNELMTARGSGTLESPLVAVYFGADNSLCIKLAGRNSYANA